MGEFKSLVKYVAIKILVTRVKPKALKSFLATILVSHKMIRGGTQRQVEVGSARLYVNAHNKKRFGLKYEGESDYRYLVASNLSWRIQDIVQAYTYRWDVPVFFEDWKLYEGWGGQLAKQPGYDGSSRSLILSLLLDDCLLLHPEQNIRLNENQQPAATVGSLQQFIQVESLLAFSSRLLTVENPTQKLEQLSHSITEVFQLAPSNKHMNRRELGNLEPSESLKSKREIVCACK